MFETLFGVVPEAASQGAADVDFLFMALLVASLAVTAIVSFLIVRFLVIYRRGTERSRAGRRRRNLMLDFGWTGGALVVFIGLFVWSAGLYIERETPPEDALRITAIGKRWMWKMQHPGGQREINSLHVPVGRPVVVELASQDVIHSFFVPAFRMKQDVVPGRATRLWFEATETGRYHLFCAEYCGAQHANMRGEIVVMEPERYAEWLDAQPEGETLAARGARLFTALGCSGCHAPGGTVKAPSLDGLYLRPVALSTGEVVIADRQYIWDSIMHPESAIVAGFPPIMPSFDGLIEPTELMAL
ncbi:MAG TPA: cytochrome c oxidase subunit II, partial [Paracoccaceae bacterium]|nr:cytochrome c oxidase subunit II [Paracoccaceae bacterium]